MDPPAQPDSEGNSAASTQMETSNATRDDLTTTEVVPAKPEPEPQPEPQQPTETTTTTTTETTAAAEVVESDPPAPPSENVSENTPANPRTQDPNPQPASSRSAVSEKSGLGMDQKPAARAPPSYDSVFEDRIYHAKDDSSQEPGEGRSATTAAAAGDDDDVRTAVPTPDPGQSSSAVAPPPEYSPPSTIRRAHAPMESSGGDPGPQSQRHMLQEITGALSADVSSAMIHGSIGVEAPTREAAPATEALPRSSNQESVVQSVSYTINPPDYEMEEFVAQLEFSKEENQKKRKKKRSKMLRAFWFGVVCVLFLAAVSSITAVLLLRDQPEGCSQRVVRVENHFFSMPSERTLNLSINAPTSVFTFSQSSDSNSVLEIQFGLLGPAENEIHGSVRQNDTMVWYNVTGPPLDECEKLTVNASSSENIMDNLSLKVIAGSLSITNIPGAFYWLYLSSSEPAGTWVENLHFFRARFYAQKGPINANSIQGTSLMLTSETSPVFLRDASITSLRISASGSDVTIQRVTSQRVSVNSTSGTLYLGVTIEEPALSADDCYLQVASTTGNILLTTTFESNKSCQVLITSKKGDFTGSFLGFRGFYTVVMRINHPDLPRTICTTNSTTQTKKCIGQVWGNLSGPGGVSHSLLLDVLNGIVTLVFS